MAETIGFRWRHLPHWTVDERPYFVTMRLAGSLARSVTEQLRLELVRLKSMGANERQVLDCRRRQFVRIEQILDAAKEDGCYLKFPAVAQLVLESLEWLERDLEWIVFAATVMPNHVHCVLQHLGGRNGRLNEDLGRIKSYTAHQANRVLGRTGKFWQDENFDHWIRSAEKFHAAVEYVKNNSVKAGLASRREDWPWTRVAPLWPSEVIGGETGLAELRRERKTAI